jgi:dTMP kinase
MLIVFEGIDGSGKETQVNALCEHFKSQRIQYILKKYPTEKAKDVKSHLLGEKELSGEDLFVHFLKDIRTDQFEIQDAVSKGKFAILDRYVFSTLAYQGVPVGYERGKSAISQMGFLNPDLVLLLDIDPKIGMARKAGMKTLDKFERDLEFLAKVRENYLRMQKERFLCDDWLRIDASGAAKDISLQIQKEITRLLLR